MSSRTKNWLGVASVLAALFGMAIVIGVIAASGIGMARAQTKPPETPSSA